MPSLHAALSLLKESIAFTRDSAPQTTQTALTFLLFPSVFLRVRLSVPAAVGHRGRRNDYGPEVLPSKQNPQWSPEVLPSKQNPQGCPEVLPSLRSRTPRGFQRFSLRRTPQGFPEVLPSKNPPGVSRGSPFEAEPPGVFRGSTFEAEPPGVSIGSPIEAWSPSEYNYYVTHAYASSTALNFFCSNFYLPGPLCGGPIPPPPPPPQSLSNPNSTGNTAYVTVISCILAK